MKFQHIYLWNSFQGILCICGRCIRKKMGIEDISVCTWRLNQKLSREETDTDFTGCILELLNTEVFCWFWVFLMKKSCLNIKKPKPNPLNQTKANLLKKVLSTIALQRTRPDCVWEYSSIAPLKPNRGFGPQYLSPTGILGYFFLSLCSAACKLVDCTLIEFKYYNFKCVLFLYKYSLKLISSSCYVKI